MKTNLNNTESEYVRASETKRMMSGAVDVVEHQEKTIIDLTKKITVADQIIRELVEQNEQYKLEIKILKKELESYKNKSSNTKINTELTANKVKKIFERKSNYIQEESRKGINELYNEMKKQYGLDY